jgi:serine/threonine protein kinase
VGNAVHPGFDVANQRLAMSELTAEKLAQRILDNNVLEARQIDTVFGELGTREVSLENFSSLLMRRGLLTNFQLDRLVKGERGGYFYGDYKLLYLVGTGTFARVYRVVNMKTGKVFALKVLRKRFREERAQTEQFLREGEIGARLRHPNIVPIYEVSSDPASPYLVMEFVEGHNLRAFMKSRRKFSPAEAVAITVDICAGLAYAAEKGMAHRDLKLSNVIVTSRGRAKLVDFGLASIAENMREGIAEESINARTIDYVGLERASGVKKDDSRSDIFFAGCILYHIVSGVPPLVETRDRLLRLSTSRFQDIRPILQIDPTLPRSLVNVVQKALELNADKRYSRAVDMMNDLKIVQKRIEEGTADADLPTIVAPGSAAALAASAAVAATEQEGAGKTVMIVESKIEMQDALRDQLKKRGYRVLIISDPERAVSRFNADEPPPADCVMFCTPDLGHSALQAFNTFASQAHTKHLPAILFIDQKQASGISTANLNERRVLLSMPLKVKELREVLLRLLRTPSTAA